MKAWLEWDLDLKAHLRVTPGSSPPESQTGMRKAREASESPPRGPAGQEPAEEQVREDKQPVLERGETERPQTKTTIKIRLPFDLQKPWVSLLDTDDRVLSRSVFHSSLDDLIIFFTGRKKKSEVRKQLIIQYSSI